MTLRMATISLLLAAAAAAQSIDGGRAPEDLPVHFAEPRVGVVAPTDVFALPETSPDVGAVSEAAETTGFQVAGYVFDAPDELNVLLSGATGFPMPDGSLVYAIELISPGAAALRVQLQGPWGRDGTELRVYDPFTQQGFGPYVWPMLDDEGRYWTTIIFGDAIGLEFRLPAWSDSDTLAIPRVTRIAYNYEPPDLMNPRGCSHRDVSCEAAWQDEADAVTMLSVLTGGGTGVSGYCSGALLNRAGSDFCPLVATANHCVGGNGGQPTANSTAFVWQFQTPSCNGTPPSANSSPRTVGSLLVKRYTDSDYNLLGLYDGQQGGFFLGWDAGSWANGAATGIHHPGGTFKRISLGSKFGNQNQTFCDSNGQNCFDAEVWNIDYTTGFTQPGSSGSPVMDSAARVRGTLSGGPSSDCTISRYGRFDLAFANLRYYLNDLANPSFVNGGVGGDAANNGSGERGTAPNPFNTVYEATFAVPAGGTVTVAPGTYNERFTLRRPMTIQRTGAAGVVRIGG